MDDLLKQTDGRKVDLNGKAAVLAVKDARVDRYEMSLKTEGPQHHRRPEYRLSADDGRAFSGLYMEFSHPGVIFPGVAGAICLLLALASLQVLPINYTGLALLLLGLALLVGEAFCSKLSACWASAGLFPLPSARFCCSIRQISDSGVDRSIIFTAVAHGRQLRSGD